LRPLRGRKKAFTLIETALAMLAIGLGLLAVFGLGRLGLQASKETDHDQRCAIMADAIFETLREYNARFVDDARTNGRPDRTWGQLWDDARRKQFDIPFPPVTGIPFPDTDITLNFSGEITSTYSAKNISLANWNPRYALVINPLGASPVAQNWNRLQVELHIYPDGDTYSSEARIFQTTLTNPGGLP
jgi:hypothetical protein